jgi:hypothetical protein
MREYQDQLREMRISYSKDNFGNFMYAVYVLEARMLQVQQHAEQAGGGSALQGTLRRMQRDMRTARQQACAI